MLNREIYDLAYLLFQSLLLGSWAWLWCDYLTMPGQMFGVVRLLYVQRMSKYEKHAVEALAKPLFDCAMCHAGWLALIQVTIDLGMGRQANFAFVVLSMAIANFLSIKTR